jgi:hypothetical protein
MSNVADTVKKAKSAKQTKQEADQALDMDLDLTAKFEIGRQMAIAEGRAILSGYHQGKLEVANFMKCDRFHQQNLNRTFAPFSMVMKMSDSEIVLFQQADEIITSLPSEMQNNPDVLDFVIEALQNKIDKIDIRTTALEIGQEQLKQAMAHGFSLVNDKFVAMQHEQEKDRIHAEYARKEAQEAKNFAQQAWQKMQDFGISVARAEEKAEGAKDLARQSRFFGFDPLTGMAVCAIAIIGALSLMSLRVEKVEPSRARSEPASYPPTYDCSNSVSNGLTTDFSKCRKVGGV